jgi:hypothetical protein
MNEEKTFNKLRQIPILEMIDKLEAIKKPSPIYRLGDSIVSSDSYYSEMMFHHERVALLAENGWEFEEFCLILEKRSILEQISVYNVESKFPMELVERAKRFFPNARFVQASIELE